jgi:hypothetical protein
MSRKGRISALGSLGVRNSRFGLVCNIPKDLAQRHSSVWGSCLKSSHRWNEEIKTSDHTMKTSPLVVIVNNEATRNASPKIRIPLGETLGDLAWV